MDDHEKAARELYQKLGRDAMLRQNSPVDTITAALKAAAEEMQERCAKAAEDAAKEGRASKAMAIAAAIRVLKP